MLPSKRILVTGGASFIGSALIWALNQRGIDRMLVCGLLRFDEKEPRLSALCPVEGGQSLRVLEVLSALCPSGGLA
jgi:nucleoside-diphosphate-sugar epimerase